MTHEDYPQGKRAPEATADDGAQDHTAPRSAAAPAALGAVGSAYRLCLSEKVQAKLEEARRDLAMLPASLRQAAEACYSPIDVSVQVSACGDSGPTVMGSRPTFEIDFETRLAGAVHSTIIRGPVTVWPEPPIRGCQHFRDRSAHVRVWLPRACRPAFEYLQRENRFACSIGDRPADAVHSMLRQRRVAATRRLQRTLREWPACPVHGSAKLEWRRSGQWCRRGFFVCKGDA